MNENNKNNVMLAVTRIKESIAAVKDDIETVCEEGKALLSKLL